MDLYELRIENLFDEFTHVIPFNAIDGLTLLHGANGVGKTTVLKIIDALSNRRFTTLWSIHFSGLQARFSNDETLTVKRNVDRKSEKTSLEFRLTESGGRLVRPPWTLDQGAADLGIPKSMIEDIVHELNQTGASEWFDAVAGDTLDINGVLDRYGDRLSQYARVPTRAKIPDWLRALTAKFPVFFIRTERLTSGSHDRPAKYRPSREMPMTPTVRTFARDLSMRIQQSLAEYSNYSQKLDSTFPARLLDPAIRVETPGEDTIRKRYNEEADRRIRYVESGLLDRDAELELPQRELDHGERRVLNLYLADVRDKLSQLDEISEKIELFLQVINAKFRRKRLFVDREQGFRVVSSQSHQLSLESLSSGEQQEIVLTYGLLFREQVGTLVLIDEPELSLHVSWQNDFIPDLLKIAGLAKLKFLVATHSPSIINDRWDLTVELSDGE
ncbi:AAA family ATPase [Streptomyces sp. NPDC017056]|uniref:AAA family ATPase n=1 Tax=Streptomyces sp. NPDC017056 TaxID=3364973 RepID=UPI0037BC7A87